MAFNTPPKIQQKYTISPLFLRTNGGNTAYTVRKTYARFVTTIPFCLCLFLSFFVLEVVVVVMMVIEEGVCVCVVGRGSRRGGGGGG